MGPGTSGIERPCSSAPPIRLGSRLFRWLPAMAAAMSLAACGGGDKGSTSATASTMPTASAMSTFSVEAGAMPENFRALGTVRTDLVRAAAASLPADPQGGTTYLKVWTDDPATGEPAVLVLGPWQADQAPARIQVATSATVVHFELYNAAGSVTGEWTP